MGTDVNIYRRVKHSNTPFIVVDTVHPGLFPYEDYNVTVDDRMVPSYLYDINVERLNKDYGATLNIHGVGEFTPHYLHYDTHTTPEYDITDFLNEYLVPWDFAFLNDTFVAYSKKIPCYLLHGECVGGIRERHLGTSFDFTLKVDGVKEFIETYFPDNDFTGDLDKDYFIHISR